MEDSSEKKPSLTDQVKAAERDKYLAEAEKALSEKDKIDYDLNQSKRFFNITTIWNTIIRTILGVGFLAFFIPYVALPIVNRDNIILGTQLAKEDDSLTKAKQVLSAKTLTVELQKKKNDSLRMVLNQKNAELSHTADSVKKILYSYNSYKYHSAKEIAASKESMMRAIKRLDMYYDEDYAGAEHNLSTMYPGQTTVYINFMYKDKIVKMPFDVRPMHGGIVSGTLSDKAGWEYKITLASGRYELSPEAVDGSESVYYHPVAKVCIITIKVNPKIKFETMIIQVQPYGL